MKIICFHNPEEENGYLSNWYPSEFCIDEIPFTSMEQYMMYKKAVLFHDMKIAIKILQTSDVAEIKRLGRAVSGYDENYWNGVRQIIVYQGLMAKFLQNAKLKDLLLSTGDSILAECAVKDRAWGIGLSMKDVDRLDKAKWKGQNLLGYALMLVRERLQAKAWEQRKLFDIYASIGNAFVGTATPYYVESGHFYLESNNIKDGQINHNSEIFINDEFYEKQKDKWLHTGDMVMVQSGHVGHAAVIPEELDNSAAHALIMFRHPKEKIEPYFLNYQYQTNKSKKKIEEITTGNTIKHILASDMQEFVVDITNYDEQKKIGSYFQKLDHLITFHQRKYEKYKKHKNDIKSIKLPLIILCAIKNDVIFIILKIYILFMKTKIVAYKLSFERKIH